MHTNRLTSACLVACKDSRSSSSPSATVTTTTATFFPADATRPAPPASPGPEEASTFSSSLALSPTLPDSPLVVGRESAELFAVVGGVRFSPPFAAGCGGSGLSFQVPRRLQLLQRDISNLFVFVEVGVFCDTRR